MSLLRNASLGRLLSAGVGTVQSSIGRTTGMELCCRVSAILWNQESRKDPGNTAFDGRTAKVVGKKSIEPALMSWMVSRAHTSLWKAVVAVKEQEESESESKKWHVFDPSISHQSRQLNIDDQLDAESEFETTSSDGNYVASHARQELLRVDNLHLRHFHRLHQF